MQEPEWKELLERSKIIKPWSYMNDIGTKEMDFIAVHGLRKLTSPIPQSEHDLFSSDLGFVSNQKSLSWPSLTSDTMRMMNPRLPVPKPTTRTLHQSPIPMIIEPSAFKNFWNAVRQRTRHLQGSSHGEAQRKLALLKKSSPLASNSEETINNNARI